MNDNSAADIHAEAVMGMNQSLLWFLKQGHIDCAVKITAFCLRTLQEKCFSSHACV